MPKWFNKKFVAAVTFMATSVAQKVLDRLLDWSESILPKFADVTSSDIILVVGILIGITFIGWNIKEYRRSSPKARSSKQVIVNQPNLSIRHEDNDRSGTFSSASKLINQYGRRTGITRKYLRVIVENTGDAIAHNCKAELKITKWNQDGWKPSTRSLLLTWNDEVKQRNVGINGKEPVLVLFADSNFGARQTDQNQEKAYALAGTKDALDNVFSFIRAQDALGAGDYEAELRVISDEGVSTMETFSIHVHEDYIKTSMALLQTPVQNDSLKERTSSIEKSPESSLDELLDEIKLFRKKWHTGIPLWSSGYRKKLAVGTMWATRGNILKHSKEILHKIKDFKSFEIKESEGIISNLEEIIDRMIELGSEIESTFTSAAIEKQTLAQDQNKISKFVSDGDKIFDDFKQVIIQLEKLRGDLP